MMRRRDLVCALTLSFAMAAISACTSTQTSTGITAPSSDKCQLQVSTTASSFSEAGGTGSLSVTTTRDCGWSAATNAPWVSLASTSGQGDASISYSVAANSVPQTRSAAITVEGQAVQLSQAAAPCRYSLSKTSDAVGYAGGTLSLTLTTLTGCGWSTSSDSGWLVTNNASGNTSTTVGFSVAANSGPARVAHALVGGQAYTVSQDAAPPPAPAPSPSPAPTPSPTPSPTPAPAPAPGPTTAQVSGTVSSLGGHCPDLSFTVSGTSVATSSSTSFSGGHCGDLKNGSGVSVTGTQSGGVISASAVQITKK